MEKWSLFLILAVISTEAFGLSFRHRRQSENEESSTEDGLEDRYGWSRPTWQGRRPGPRQDWYPGPNQFPGQWQGQFPGQWQNQFPGQGQGQFPGQWQFPGQGQGQFPGQWQLPGQGQGQLPGQGQGQLPGQGQGQLPGQGQQQLPGQDQGRTTTPAPNGNGSTTQSSSVQACIRTCPVTAEYNPVCGSDNVTYNNPGSLNCAQACGVNVNLLRSSRCPATIQAN